MDESGMVMIERYADVRQAEFALSVLEGSGVEAYIDIPFTSSMFPHYALTSGVALLVRAEDLERAREVLAEGNGPAAE